MTPSTVLCAVNRQSRQAVSQAGDRVTLSHWHWSAPGVSSSRRYTGDRRSPSPSGRITADTRIQRGLWQPARVGKALQNRSSCARDLPAGANLSVGEAAVGTASTWCHVLWSQPFEGSALLGGGPGTALARLAGVESWFHRCPPVFL